MDKTTRIQFRLDTLFVATALTAILVWGVMHWQASGVRWDYEFNRLWWESKMAEPYQPSHEMSERVNAWKPWQMGLIDLSAAVGLIGAIAYVVRRRLKQRRHPRAFQKIHVPDCE